MKAVILAAGASKRLLPYTKNLPKCLLTVGDKSILEHQL
ncbi:MAG TPA: sugar phosphate nucleotidyltransferase, partial [Spirochaetota bacterium]|nr:sugar phosphate nucleotidyltransferase [Spirochaetota bacterium]